MSSNVWNHNQLSSFRLWRSLKSTRITKKEFDEKKNNKESSIITYPFAIDVQGSGMRDDWIKVKLGQVLELKKDKFKPIKEKNLFYIGLEHIEKNTGNLTKSFDKEPICTVKNEFKTGDLLYGKLRPYLNKTHLSKHNGVCSTDILVFTPHTGLEGKYAHKYFLSRAFVNNMSENTSGVNLPRVSTKHIQNHVFPLPPLPEQRAIVAKIEQLFSDLDNGIANLKTAKEKLSIYRQSVLKKAFEGELTKEWRSQQTDLPTADELLAQIKEERQRYYNQQLKEWQQATKKWEMNGKAGKKPGNPSKIKPVLEISKDELSLLPTLPPCWRYARLFEISEIGSGMSVSKNRKIEDAVEVPYLRVANVQRGFLDLKVMRTMPVEKSSLTGLLLKNWDILFNEGGDRDKLGRGWIWESKVSPCITQNHVFRASLHKVGESPAKFVSYWGNTFGKEYFERTGKQTTNLASINKGVLSRFPVPVLSAQEQAQIVQEIESRLSVCDKLEESITTSLQQAEALRQSILKRAFEGKLLTDAELTACRQEPDWEPAEKFLRTFKEGNSNTMTQAKRKR